MFGSTNTKIGGGLIRDGCAILEVKAPAQSEIIAVRSDGLTKKQNKGYLDFSDSDFWLYYIVIQQFELSNLEWTISIEEGTEQISTTIIINSNKQYRVILSSKFYLYKNGKNYNNFDPNFIAGNNKFTININDDNIYLKGTNNGRCGMAWYPAININRHGYTTLSVVLESGNLVTTTNMQFFGLWNGGSYIYDEAKWLARTAIDTTFPTTVSLYIADYSAAYGYMGFRLQQNSEITIKEIYLEDKEDE